MSLKTEKEEEGELGKLTKRTPKIETEIIERETHTKLPLFYFCLRCHLLYGSVCVCVTVSLSGAAHQLNDHGVETERAVGRCPIGARSL